jgi:CysZ protein
MDGMNPVTTALSAALRDLREPRILALGLLPPFAALLVWAAFAWALADDWARLVADWIASTPWLGWVADWGLAAVFIWGSGIAALGLLLPVMLITAMLVIGVVAMPLIVPFVGERHYPGLAMRRGGGFWASAWNSAVATVIFAVLWLVTLPLWLTGVGALLLPLLLSAWFNRRVLAYDALAEHADAAELAGVLRAARGELFLLGFLLSLLLYVPFANLLMPVLSGLAFTHYGLARLARMRAAS